MNQQVEQEQTIFQRIIFEECDRDAELRKLSNNQKERLKDAIAQKMAYEAVYKPCYPQVDYIEPSHTYHAPSLMATLCCFLYPENHRQSFDVTSELFARKVGHVFLIWRDDFLDVKDENVKDENARQDAETQPDLYGPLWLSITYIILLGLTANINNYFVNQTNFAFNSNFVVQAIGFTLIFLIAEILIYPAVVGCLEGQMSNPESTTLVGYSLMLYFIPTLLCIIPSQLWHMIMLLIAAGLRFIFLGRNYSSRVDSKQLLIYIVILALQGLHFYLIMSTFYAQVAGTSIDSGLQKVLHARSFSQ